MKAKIEMMHDAKESHGFEEKEQEWEFIEDFAVCKRPTERVNERLQRTAEIEDRFGCFMQLFSA